MEKRKVAEVFTPSKPVKRTELFVGREGLLRDLGRSLEGAGENPVVVGPRGVGKTSLVVQALADRRYIRIDCNEDMTFDTVARGILRELGIDTTVLENVETEGEVHRAGVRVGAEFGRDGTQQRAIKRRGVAESRLQPWDLFCELREIAPGTIVVLDEFDRLGPRAEDVRRGFADLSKTVSNYDFDLKFVFVGVARSIRALLGSHASSFRSLTEIKVPPLPVSDIEKFLRTAEYMTGVSFESRVRFAVASDSEGFPYYAHQVALRSVYAAEDRSSNDKIVTWHDMEEGIVRATRAAFDHLLAQYRNSVARLTSSEKLLLTILLEKGPGRRMSLGQLRETAIEARALSSQHFVDSWDGISKRRGLVFVRKGATDDETEKSQIYFVEPLLAPFLRQILRIQKQDNQFRLFEGPPETAA